MIMDYELQYKNKVIPFTSTLRSLHFSYWKLFYKGSQRFIFTDNFFQRWSFSVITYNGIQFFRAYAPNASPGLLGSAAPSIIPVFKSTLIILTAPALHSQSGHITTSCPSAESFLHVC